MEAKITGIIQDYSFESGSIQNYLKLRLPDNTEVQVAITEDTALIITKSFVGDESNDRKIAQAGDATPSYSTVPNELSAFKFDSNPEERAPVQVDPGVVDDYEEEPKANGQSDLPAPSWTNPRRVVSNEYGYPVLQGAGVVDPGEITGGEDMDEDGIGSV